jgi:NAD(P)-dependent dehydrogenase (short-subunit alcohol dehydrogenase family)
VKTDLALCSLFVATCSGLLAVKYGSAAMKLSHPSKSVPGGSLILTASVAGLRSGAGGIDYSASKAAVISLASSAAWSLARTGIRVNAVCPGLVETGMTKPLFDGARQRGTVDKVGQLNPLGRYAVAEEVSGASVAKAKREPSERDEWHQTDIPTPIGLRLYRSQTSSSSSHQTTPRT